MNIFNLSGDDTLVINSKVISNEFADGDNCTIEFSDELVSLSTGKNQNTVYALNESGNNFTLTFSVLRGGEIDKYLNGLLAQQKQDFVGCSLLTGAFTKRLGDGYGKVSFDTYTLRGMAFTQHPSVKGNVNGDTEQNKIEYTLKGVLAVRGIL